MGAGIAGDNTRGPLRACTSAIEHERGQAWRRLRRPPGMRQGASNTPDQPVFGKEARTSLRRNPACRHRQPQTLQALGCNLGALNTRSTFTEPLAAKRASRPRERPAPPPQWSNQMTLQRIQRCHRRVRVHAARRRTTRAAETRIEKKHHIDAVLILELEAQGGNAGSRIALQGKTPEVVFAHGGTIVPTAIFTTAPPVAGHARRSAIMPLTFLSPAIATPETP